MAATTAGALKAYIEAQGLSLPVFRRRAPNGQAPPFVTVDEAVSVITDRSGDQGDQGAVLTVTELATVNLWQARTNPDGSAAERYDLPGRLVTLLRAARLVPVGTSQVHGIPSLTLTYVPDPDPDVVHHAITCTIRREA